MKRMTGFQAGWWYRATPGLFSIAGDDEILQFPDEDAPEGDSATGATTPWVVLIVDDDRGVHEVTLLALGGERVQGRPLQFLHAYSASEARQKIAADRSIALVLLDVVMETEDAGLRLIGDIRGELGRADLKIILRTGQPGYASEYEVTRKFSLDGYVLKSETTRGMLLDAIAIALAPVDEKPVSRDRDRGLS